MLSESGPNSCEYGCLLQFSECVYNKHVLGIDISGYGKFRYETAPSVANGRYQYPAGRWLTWTKENYLNELYAAHVASRSGPA